MLKKMLAPNPLIFLSFIWGVIYFYFSSYPLLQDYDTSWHIQAGNLISKLGYVPKVDSWSFTAEGMPWYNVSWLWDLFISYLAKYLGLNGLFFLTIIFYSYILTFTTSIIIKHKDIKPAAAGFIIFLTTFVLVEFLSARPNSFTYLVALIFYKILYFSRNKIKLTVLPVLMALWVNMHGGFLIGFVIISIFALNSLIKKNKKEFFEHLVLFVLCALATLINPYGFELHASIKNHLGDNFTFFINEWASFKIGDYVGQTIFLLAFIFFARFTDKKIDMRDKMLSFALMLFSLFSLRFFPLFSLLSSVFLASSLSNVSGLRNLNFLEKYKKHILFGSIIILLILFLDTRVGILRENITEADKMPLKSIDFAINKYPDIRFLNSYEIGGYIIFRSEEKMKVFVDGRAATVYPSNVLQDFASILTDTITVKDIVKKYNIEGVIAGNNDNFIRTFSRSDSGFEKVFSCENGAVFIRKDLLKN